MKFPQSWLADFVDLPLTGEALGHALTMAGLEVEEMDPAAPAFDNVVVARVMEVVKHPDADRLNVCQVDAGEGSLRQIVCGAPNVAAGMTVPCALPGAKLPGGLEIKIAKVRGVESSGMLCSARELGIAEDASGLLPLDGSLTPGQSVRDALQLDDLLFTLKLTPNRGDCLSLFGIAREVSAITGAAVKAPAVPAVPVTIDTAREVKLDAPEACPIYCGRVLAGVNAKAATPEWMRVRLERCGVRSISALVDITNYVMLELGQPMHAFDNAKLSGAVHARMAKSSDRLLLLNGQTIEVAADVLMIADDAKAVAMAGIMGGEDSGITLDTTEVFLESAFFAPKAVAGRARRYGFGSDASHRFERGVDFGGVHRALERASQLILEICGGEAGPLVEACAELPARPPVNLRLPRLQKVLGIAVPEAAIGGYFDRLGLAWVRTGDVIAVTPPSHRFDIEIEEDLIEEVARLYGFDNVPVRPPVAALQMQLRPEAQRPVARLRQTLAERGFQEVINFAFVEEGWEADFAGNTAPIRLANPIASQMSVMRSTLLGGLLQSLGNNLRRKQPRVRLFETGRCFFRDAAGQPVAGFRQPWRLGVLAHGPALPEQWGAAARAVDFFDLKADVEALLVGRVLRFEKLNHPALHPGRAARVIADGQDVGVLGEVHPRWVQKYDLGTPPVVFELDLESLLAVRVPAYAQLSNQPAVMRDLALVVDHDLPLQALLDAIAANRPGILQEVQPFDVYAGKGIENGKKSIAFRIFMQDTE